MPYGLGRVGYRGARKGAPQREKSKPIDLSSLTLTELKKVRKSCQDYVDKKNAYDLEAAKARSLNQEIDNKNNAIDEASAKEREKLRQWEKDNIAPLDRQISDVDRKLDECKVGFFGEIFGGDHVISFGNRYKKIPGERLLEERRDLYNRREN